MKSTQLLHYADKPSEFLEAFWTLPNGKAPKLYDYQKEFLDYPYKEGPRRLEIVNKSRQTGFSTVCLTGRAFHESYFALAPKTMFVSASERQAIELLEHVKNAIDALPQQLRPQLTKDKEIQLRMKNGCEIISVPQSESSIRGYNGNIILDEFAFQKKDRQIWSALLPSLRGGNRITVNSTPMGKGNEYYRLWSLSDEPGYAENTPLGQQWKRFTIPWWLCKDIAIDIELYKANLTEMAFKQEYCCEFIDEATAFFTFDLIASAVDEEMVNAKGYAGKNKITFGIDLARKNDETVIVVTEHLENNAKRVIALEPLVRKDYTTQYNYITRMIEAFNPAKVYVDATGVGIPMSEALQKDIGSRCAPITFTNPLKEKMINDLKILMEDGRIKIPDDKTLRAQLHGLEKTVTEHGNVRYKHRAGGHDDRCWALALSVYSEYNARKMGGSFFAVNF